MLGRIKRITAAALIVLGLSVALVPAPIVGAVSSDAPALGGACENNVVGASICADDKKGANVSTTAKDVINVLLFVVGAASVIMIIVGGLFYATSTGDPSRVTRAKSTITYAVAGLVVSFLAYAIVNFVVDRFK